MKAKYLLPLAIAALVPAAAPAQTPKGLGIHAAMEVTMPSGASSIYKNGAGLTLGAHYRLPLPKKFYFEPGLLFNFTAMTAKDLVSFDDKYFYQGAANIYGLRIPLTVGYSVNLADFVNLDVSTGPWINFNISATQKLLPNFSAPEIVPNKTIDLFDHGWNRVDALWGIHLGATFADNYYVGLSTGLAFTPLASFGNKDKKIRIHRNTVAVTLGYRF